MSEQGFQFPPGSPLERGQRWAWVRGGARSEGGPEPPTMKFCKAVVRQVSARGVCLILTWRPGTEELLSVELPGFVRPRLARVRSARPQSGGCWITGCDFDSPLEEQELRAFGQQDE